MQLGCAAGKPGSRAPSSARPVREGAAAADRRKGLPIPARLPNTVRSGSRPLVSMIDSTAVDISFKVLRGLRAELGADAALALALRLLCVRRLELRAEEVRKRLRSELADELERLAPPEAEALLQAKLRDELPGLPRQEDSLERLARLPEDAMAEAIAAYLGGFTGAAGQKVRDAETAASLRKLSDAGRLHAVLSDVAAGDIGAQRLDEDSYDALERALLADASGGAAASGSDGDARLVEVWLKFRGLPTEARSTHVEVHSAELSLDVDHDRRIHWAMERSGVPIVREVRLRNRGSEELRDLRLTLQVGPSFSGVFEVELSALAPGAEARVDRPDLCIDSGRLRELQELEHGALHVEVRQGPRVLLRESRPIDVLPWNEWNTALLPELIAAFVLPNDPAVATCLETARDVLGETTGDPVLAGYEARSRERARAVVRAVYQTIERLGITLASPTASFESSGQRLRSPSQVLAHRMGTGVDLAVMVAAALEAAGLNPVLAMGRGQVFAGAWLIDDWLPSASSDDPAAPRKLAAAGEMTFIDVSLAARRPAAAPEAAEGSAIEKVSDGRSFEYLVDVRAARLARVLPLPLAATPGSPASAAAKALAGAKGPERTDTRPGGGAAPAADTPQKSAGESAIADSKRPRNARVEAWKERLLDLSLRNRLLNFRTSRDKSVAIDLPELPLLDDRLATGEALTLEPRVELDENDPRVAELLRARGAEEYHRGQRLELLASGHLLTQHAEEDLQRRLVAIFRAARVEVEETGSSTLFLAVGMLRWIEGGTAGPQRSAPVLLYPVEISRASARSRLRIQLRDDEPRLNETLLEKLRVDFDVDTPELKGLPFDEAGVDVAKVLTALRRGIARLPGFEVHDEAFLAFFSFSKFLMWRDLDEHADDLLKSELMRHLAEGRGTWTSSSRPVAAADLEREVPPSRARLVLDADSSQHVAVDAALKGATFVLQGPPGTGKSQTIANIIGECLAAGKRVLFVAEKRVALEVVARRLKSVGLGDFCLELHSSKANKKAVALELAAALERDEAAASEASGVERLASKVEESMQRLSGYAKALHAPTSLGASIFEAFARFLELRDAPSVQLGPLDVHGTDREAQEKRLEALDEIAAAAEDVGSILGHPFEACSVAPWSAVRARQWESEIQALRAAAASVVSIGARASKVFCVPLDSIDALETSRRLLALLAEGPPEGSAVLLGRTDAGAALARLEEAASRAEERSRLIASLAERFEPSILNLDVAGLLAAYRRHVNRFAPLRWLALRGPAASLRALAKKRLPPASALVQVLEAAVRAVELGSSLDRETPFLAELIGAAARGAETSPSALRRLASFAARWREVAARAPAELRGPLSALPDLSAASGQVEPLGLELEKSLGDLRRELARVTESLVVDAAKAFAGQGGATRPDAVLDTVKAWLENLSALRPWTRFAAAEARVRASDLGPVADAVRQGTLAATEAAAAYERAFLERWIEATVEAATELRGFNGREHERCADAFRRSDRELIERGGPAIAALLARSRPATSASAPATSEVGILRREARKKTRHVSVRRLLSQIPNLLERLKPCLLMSPLSIAQYLPPSREPFDVVLFDEASQIPTHDAVGAIARGRQVIVVGDSKQLPPTAFFQVALDDEDLEADAEEPFRIEELESILDECVAAQLPSLLLRWHYRSRDERLIAFSNRNYYDDQLLTFPRPDEGKAKEAEPGSVHATGVHRVSVPGVFDRSKSRTNRVEAEAVVRWVVDSLRDPHRRGRSIGIVTFNQPQQNLIEDLLDQARRKHPEIEPYFSDQAAEPVFVKNLENVQGDERDVILFSVTYAPDSAGRVWMGFGALNVEGGERRLNVAITRARFQLVVFTALDSSKIDLSRSRALGVAHLKAFLRYAEGDVPAARAETGSEGKTSGLTSFERAVIAGLEARGHRVDAEVGLSGYRLDVAARDPGPSGRHVLGIECDGAAYAAAPTARDRDRLRASVLAGLGWRLCRVWSLDWWQDPGRELDRIEKAIAQAKAVPAAADASGANARLREVSTAPAEADEDRNDTPGAARGRRGSDRGGDRESELGKDPGAEEPLPEEPAPPAEEKELGLPAYRPCALEERSTPWDSDSSKGRAAAASLFVRVAEEEAPVHREVAIRRVGDSLGVARLTQALEARLEAALAQAVESGRLQRIGDFLWSKRTDPATWDAARGPGPGGELREPEHLAPEETGAAALLVIESAVALSREDLVRSAALLMGYRRLTSKVRLAFEKGIDLLASRGRCRIEGDVVRESRELNQEQ